MVLSIIFLEDKHTILLHLSIFYEYQQFCPAMYLFILDKNNERPDWMTDLKHTDSAWLSKVTQVNSLSIYLYRETDTVLKKLLILIQY
jgi:hypothetical protein